jgi:hypothetical protein
MKYRLFVCVKILLLFLLIPVKNISCQTKTETNYVVKINPADLNGKWFLVMSNLRTWKKKGKTNSMISFSVKGDSIREILSFLESGKTINSSATGLVTGSARFSEKGRGGMNHSGRSWYVVAMDDDKRWIVIYVKGGFLRKDAIQVISRDQVLSEKATVRIRKLFAENYFLQAKTKKMRLDIQK